MLQKKAKPNRQAERTRSWIFDALMLLMDEKPYNKITISDIIEKAGIARPTFYRNYDSIEAVAFEHLAKTIKTEYLHSGNGINDDKQNTIILMFDYGYMIEHRKNLKKIISTVDIEDRLFREMQKFPVSLTKKYREKLSPDEYLICRYKLNYQITGCLRVIFDWFINDMPMPAENIVSMLNAMNIPKTIQYRNIPGIVVRLNGV